MTRKTNWIVILALTFVAGAGCLCAEEYVEELEARYTAAFQSFEIETRSELTRIARDKSLTGEEKILRTEAWFATHAQRMAVINAMADTLDDLKPIPREPRPVRPADPSPEGITAATLHTLSRRFSQGEITPFDFHRLRSPLLDSLDDDTEKRSTSPSPPTVLPPLPGSNATPVQLARVLHAHNRHLSTLPPQDAAAIRADPLSPVNLLPGLIQAKPTSERTGQSTETFTNQPSPTR